MKVYHANSKISVIYKFEQNFFQNKFWPVKFQRRRTFRKEIKLCRSVSYSTKELTHTHTHIYISEYQRYYYKWLLKVLETYDRLRKRKDELVSRLTRGRLIRDDPRDWYEVGHRNAKNDRSTCPRRETPLETVNKYIVYLFNRVTRDTLYLSFVPEFNKPATISRRASKRWWLLNAPHEYHGSTQLSTQLEKTSKENELLLQRIVPAGSGT